MEEMVRVHLGLKQKPKPDDAADALAAAITCGFLYRDDDIIVLDKFANNRRKDDITDKRTS